MTLRALTWSNYKHHNTVKILVGISPTDAVSFISKAFGERGSDKLITQKSGFLQSLEYGDKVLADRVFFYRRKIGLQGSNSSNSKLYKRSQTIKHEKCRGVSKTSKGKVSRRKNDGTSQEF